MRRSAYALRTYVGNQKRPPPARARACPWTERVLDVPTRVYHPHAAELGSRRPSGAVCPLFQLRLSYRRSRGGSVGSAAISICRTPRTVLHKGAPMSVAAASDSILGGLHDVLDDLEDFYKDVHSHPELSLQE